MRRGESPAQLAASTSANARRFFALPALLEPPKAD